MARTPRGFVEEHFNKIFKVFNKFSSIEPTFFAVVCLVIVILGSLICDHHQLPEFYLSNKRSIFNVLFAKWSMAWTLASLTPFMVATWWVKSENNLKVVCKSVSRLVVAFAIWFGVTRILDFIEHTSGQCEGSDLYSTKYECLTEGLLWDGVDISGHSFILSYCTLIISEEIKVINFWTSEDTPKESPTNGINQDKKSSPDGGTDIRERKLKHPRSNKTVFYSNDAKQEQEFVIARYVSYGFYVLCCLLMLMWVLLLAITSLYFHTVTTKLIGIGLGLSSWFFTYDVLFKSNYFHQVTNDYKI